MWAFGFCFLLEGYFIGADDKTARWQPVGIISVPCETQSTLAALEIFLLWVLLGRVVNKRDSSAELKPNDLLVNVSLGRHFRMLAGIACIGVGLIFHEIHSKLWASKIEKHH